MTPTPPKFLSGPELRRATSEAFGGRLFTHRRVTEGRPSRPAEYVPAKDDDNNSMSPPTEAGAVANTPFTCPKCAAKATLHQVAKYCLRCGTPTVAPAESVRADAGTVHESGKPAEKRVAASNLSELRRAVGTRFFAQPMQQSPLPAHLIRKDMEDLAMRSARNDQAERLAYAKLAAK